MNFFKKWGKRIKRLKKGHKVYKTVSKNSNKIALAVTAIHKAVIK